MAIIYTYPVKTTPANDDLILISDSADGNKTKQIKVSSMPGAQGSGITTLGVSGSGQTGATQTLASGNAFLTIGSSANTHTFNINGALPTTNGGTGLTTIGTADQVLSVNLAANALQYSNPKVTKIVKNNTGSTILAGTPVYISGVTGSTPTIAIADASDNNKLPVAGLVTADIADGSDGTIMVAGSITGVTTNNIGVAAPGDLVYVGATAGSGIPFLTGTKPVGVNSIQALGIVSKVATSGQGIIEVNIQSDVEGLPNFGGLGRLWVGDATGAVRVLTLGADEHVLTADSSVTGGVKWAAVGAAAGSVSSVNFDTTGLTPNVASTGAVTVGGILAAKNGGTGYGASSSQSTNYAVGDLLYANTTTSLVTLNLGSAGKVLTVNPAGTAPIWANPSVTAAGDAGNIQFNNGSGVFTASTNLSYNTATNTLDVGEQGTAIGNLNVNGSSSAVGTLKLGGSGSGVNAPFVSLQPSGASIDTYTIILPRNKPTFKQSLFVSSVSGTGTGSTVQLDSRDKIPVDHGGTNQTTIGAYAVVVGSGATTTELSSAATGAIQMPAGTTAQRPGSPVNGMIRYNSTTSKMEAYAGGAWVDLH